MSRVRVLNLPPTVTDNELKKHFITSTSAAALITGSTASGKKVDLTLTDSFIVRHKTRNIVRMAFLGFKTTAAAAAIIDHFNGSYIGSNKLIVEAAMGVEDALAHKKSREAKSDARWERERERKEKLEKKEADEAAGIPSTRQKRTRDEEAADKKGGGDKREGEEGGQPNDDMAHFVQDRTDKGPTFATELMLPVGKPNPDGPDAVKAAAAAEAEEELAEAEALKRQQELENVSDLDFLGNLGGGSQKKAEGGDETPATAAGATAAGDVEEEMGDEQLVRATRRIHVKNLPFSATENDVKNLFGGTIGPIESILLPLTRDTKQSKGFAFIQFVNADDAVAALSLHMTSAIGRLIRVCAAQIAPVKEGEEAGADSSKVQPKHKEDREKRKEAEIAGKSSGINWNPLYLASSSAVSTMAKRMDVSEKDLVSQNVAGAAVTTAIAEAVLTTEAKRILGEDGIDLEKVTSQTNALHRNRSNTTILAKNLGPGVSLPQLLDQFKKCGPLDTVASPTDPTFLLVSFVHPQDARTAFHRLAYKKFGGTPLFLEWAPVGCIKDDADMENDDVDQDAVAAALKKRLADRKAATTGGGDDDDESSALQTSLATYTAYITNIPFNIGDEALRAFIQDTAPRVSGDNILQRLDYHPDSGRAYVTVSDEASLKYLVSRLQGKTFNNRTIACQISDSTSKKPLAPSTAVPSAVTEVAEDGTPQVPPGRDPMKLIIKNLPFEATENELRELFKSFTEVKAVRVPRKVHQTQSHRDNNHRGFGFVEFLTQQEAANALRSLSNTHLYGRHLVLEYAGLSNTGA